MLPVLYLLHIAGACSAQHEQEVLALNCCQIQYTVSFNIACFLQPTFMRKKKNHQSLFAFRYKLLLLVSSWQGSCLVTSLVWIIDCASFYKHHIFAPALLLEHQPYRKGSLKFQLLAQFSWQQWIHRQRLSSEIPIPQIVSYLSPSSWQVFGFHPHGEGLSNNGNSTKPIKIRITS